MRPVLLQIDGFTSYRTKASVDFNDADFFVLVGPTGAGKSTIIDAMIFALFGTVPRWDDRSAVAPALAPSANRAVVRLIFDVGGKRYSAARDVRRGGRKTATVTVKEARLEQFVSTEATGAPEDETEVLASGSPNVTKAVESLLGMTFEQFTQAVALPQGDFACFLHATDGQRQAILKDLLGFGVYDDIQRAANSRAANHKLRADTLAEQLEGYADATEGSVAALARVVTELREFQTQVTTISIPALMTASEHAAQARGRAEQLTRERNELLAVTVPAEVGDLDALRQSSKAALDLAEGEQIRIEEHDRHTRERLQAVPPRHQLEQTLANRIEMDRTIAALPALADAASLAGEKLREAAEARDHATAALDAARSAAADADRVADDHRRSVEETQRGLHALETVAVPAGLEAITAAIRDRSSQLTGAKAALSRAEAAQKTVNTALAAAADAAVVTSAHREAEELTTMLAQDAQAAAQHGGLAQSVAEAQQEAARADGVLTAAQAAVHEVEQRDKAAALRAEVTVGDDCPVCGQQITELPAETGGDTIDAARSDLRNAQDAATAATRASVQCERQLSEARAVRTQQLRRCEDFRGQLLGHLAVLGITDTSPALDLPVDKNATDEELSTLQTAASAALTKVAEVQDKQSVLEDERRGADANVDAARTAVQHAEQAAALAEANARAARAALRDARDSVSVFNPPAVDDADIERGWDDLMQWVSATIQSVTEQLTSLSASADDTAATAARRNEELKLADAVAADAQDLHTTAALAKQHADEQLGTTRKRNTELSQLLSDAPGIDEIRAQLDIVIVLQKEVDAAGVALQKARESTSAARDALRKADAAVSESWQQLRRLRDPLTSFGAPEIVGTDLATDWRSLADWSAAQAATRVAQIATSESAAAQADTEVQGARDALVDALTAKEIAGPEADDAAAFCTEAASLVSAALATARAAMERGQERLRESERMREQMKGEKEKADVAGNLANLMRTNNFQRWLIGSALDTLLDDASKILLELSGGQFELSRDERDLLVIDHNDADMRRLVKTLSGGETFQASLALALALSEHVAALSTVGASKLESIFLDEGFGTLDDTTLDVVAGTLETLASAGSRMVGVITHVGALAERIPVRFEVTRDSAGSHVRREQLSTE